MDIKHYELKQTPETQTDKAHLFVADEIFGNCLKLTASESLTLESATNTSKAFGLSLWIKPENLPATSQTLLKGMDQNGTSVLSIENTASRELIFHAGPDTNNLDTLSYQIDSTQYSGDWQNWAFSKNAETGTMAIWLNGKNVTSQTEKTKAPGNLHQIQLGGSFKGRFSNLRIYDQPLDAKQLETTFNSDLNILTAFHKENPIDFWLHDDSLLEILPITDDPKGETLHLEIINTSAKPMTLTESTVLELRFRPGILSENCKKLIREQKEEKWSIQLIEQTDHTESLLLKPQQGTTLSPGKEQALSIALPGMSAAAAGGARSTRIELHYSDIHFDDPNAKQFSGIRSAQLDIIKNKGIPFNPFSMSLSSSHQIFNDGKTPNHLLLRIANAIESEKLHLTPESKFILSFDEGPTTASWALGSHSQIQGIHIAADPKEAWTVERNEQASSTQWEIKPTSDQTLAFTEGVSIDIQNIVTNYPDGMCKLHLRYHNIPNIQDGYATCTLEKTLLKLRTGMIMMWSGDEKEIPAGWSLCNGQNGTPDLRDRFVIGAGGSHPLGKPLGSDEIIIKKENMPKHAHTVTDPGHQHDVNRQEGQLENGGHFDGYLKTTDRAQPNHNPKRWGYICESKTGISIGEAGEGKPLKHMPPFYALCYIMYSGRQ